MKNINYSTKTVLNYKYELIAEIKIADSFPQRLKGLLGSRTLEPYSGLLITPCRQVHSIGMNYSISVWFLDHSYRIIKIIDSLQPYKVSLFVKDSHYVLELPEKWAEYTKTREGDHLIIQ